METLGLILIALGGIITAFYGIVLLIKAFQTSILWGLGSLFVPFVSLIFIVVYWNIAKKPFLMSFVGIPFIIIGSLLMPEASFVETFQETDSF